MSEYKAIQKQIKELESKAEQAKANERANAIAVIRQTMAEFGITLTDLGAKKRGPRKGITTPVYRDPESGKTWTGIGRPPRWFDMGNADALRIAA